jgi:hypothetical protein
MEIRMVKVGITQACSRQVGSMQIRGVKIRPSQFRAMEIGAVQIGAVQISAFQISFLKVCSMEIGLMKIGIQEEYSPKVGAMQIRSMQIRSLPHLPAGSDPRLMLIENLLEVHRQGVVLTKVPDSQPHPGRVVQSFPFLFVAHFSDPCARIALSTIIAAVGHFCLAKFASLGGFCVFL